MAPVYRKTEKGHAEIETRANRLVPRLRSALIVIDGRRSSDELHKLILNQPDETLAVLLDQGYIELIAGLPARASSRHEGGTPTSPGTPTMQPGQAPSALGVFPLHCRQAARFLNEHLGPAAESLAIKIEKAHDWAELRPHLEAATEVLRSGRSAAAAHDFAARFVDSLP
jgi:hypothetical protein